MTEQKTLPEIAAGMTVRVHQRIKEVAADGGKEKERIQIFEGMVIACRGGKTKGATFIVRKISDGIPVEKIYPLHLPSIEKIEVVKKAKVRRAQLYFLRDQKKKFKEIKEIAAK